MEASHISIRTKEVIKEIGLKELIEHKLQIYMKVKFLWKSSLL